MLGGTYYRTYTNSGDGGTGLADPATVSGFRLDKYDVTVGRFRQFVAAWNGGAGYTPAAGSGKHTHLNGSQGLANSASPGTYESGWITTGNGYIHPTDANLACNPPYDTWTSTAGTQENLPINCVNWYEAYAFCIWDQGFLPSRAEWEYAAAGGSQQREYPWGFAAPGTANQYAIYADVINHVCYYPSDGPCMGVANIAPVGSAPLGAGLWAQLDLTGNMQQWSLDWAGPYFDPCVDCASTTSGSSRVLVGGYFIGPLGYLPATFSFPDDPASRNYSYGFRCARTP